MSTDTKKPRHKHQNNPITVDSSNPEPTLDNVSHEPIRVSENPLNSDQEASLLQNLTVIASLQSQHRISTLSSGILVIHPPSEHFTWLTRLLSFQSREINLKYIESMINLSFEYLEYLLTRKELHIMQNPNDTSRTDVIDHLETQQKMNRFIHAIEKVRTNISHLADTYSTDMRTVTRIEILQNSIQDRLECIQTSISYINKHKPTG